VLNRAREWWERLGRTNQLTLVLTTVGVLVALIGFVAWASTPEYVPLFSKLSAQDAMSIRDKLAESGVPNRLTQGGTTIEVPAQSVDEMKMKMLSQGLPQSSTATAGDDLKGINTMAMTSKMEEETLNSLLEKRVSRSIMSMDAVANATVHFAAGDESPLLLSNHDSTASVLVTCKPGHTLSDENVHAILRLVQMSCTGLQEKNISVVDSQGEMLWDGQHGGMAGGADIAKQQRAIETSTRAELQAALNLVCGPRSSVVTVHAELNNDDKQEHKITSEPGSVVSKTTENESLNGAGSVNGKAALGAMGNVNGVSPAQPGVPNYQAQTKEPDANYKHETGQITYEPSKTDTITHVGQGKIEKMSVSVLLDKNKYKDPVALADTEAKIKETVATTIGIAPNETTTTRLVSVVAMPFDHTQEIQDAQAGEQQRRAELIRQLAALLVPFAIMAIALFVLARALRKPNALALSGMPALAGAGAGRSSLLLDASGVPIPGQRIGGVGEMEGEDGPLALLNGVTPSNTYEVIEEAFDSQLESILHLTRSKPEMVAALFKGWVNEDS
jgi:flagellar M-ring protein FliF